MKSALGGTRTPNLLIRSQMLYPLSYKRLGAIGNLDSLAQLLPILNDYI
jgi:hypothetical protein